MSKILNSRISNYVNCWIVKIKNTNYAIMPAHVAVYQKNNIWLKSTFLTKCEHISLFNYHMKCDKKSKYNKWYMSDNLYTNYILEWHTSLEWFKHKNINDDFAWAKLPDKLLLNTILEPSNKNLDIPIDVDFYYHQPYDIMGKLTEEASLGKIKGTIYKSPQSKLLEACNIGFRGMSGAIVLDEFSNYVGMFVRKGENLGSSYVDKSNTTYDFTQNMSSICRGIIMPHNLMIEHITKGGINIDKFFKI